MRYAHTRFRVSDMEASLRFYHDVLGMEIVDRSTSPRGSQLVFLKFPQNDAELELCAFPSSGGVSVPEDLVHLAFEVDDLDVWMQRLQAGGAPITEGPVESRGGSRFIFTEDPDKYEIEIIQRPKP